MILGDEEQRVVSETTRTAMFRDNDAMTTPLGDRNHFARRVGQSRDAYVIGSPAIVRQILTDA